MKKLTLKALALDASKILTRKQLKNVFGGSGSGSGCDPDTCPSNECGNCPNGKKCVEVACACGDYYTIQCG